MRTIEIEQAKDISNADAVKKSGISLMILGRWKKEYDGLRVDQAEQLKDLEQENGRLIKLVADLSIDNSILKEVSLGNF